jgi:hypothetical protein
MGGPVPADLACGPPCTYPGVIGCQLEGADLTSGDQDQSLVYDGALWVPEPPAAPPVGKAQAEAAVAGILENLAVLTRAAGQLGRATALSRRSGAPAPRPPRPAPR